MNDDALDSYEQETLKSVPNVEAEIAAAREAAANTLDRRRLSDRAGL